MELSTVFSICGIVSCILASSVVITILTFRKHMLTASRPFSHCLLMISLCDVFTSIGYSLGFPSAGSMACAIQGFAAIFFPTASITWTSMLILQLWTTAVFKFPVFSILSMHLLVWMIPCFMAFVPLSTNDYGQDDIFNGSANCLLGGNQETKTTWLFAIFGSFLVQLFVILTLVADMMIRLLRGFLTSKVKIIFETVVWYAVALIICFVPIVVTGFYTFTGHYVSNELFTAVDIFITFYGALVAIIFFMYCDEARTRWRLYLWKGDVYNDDTSEVMLESETDRLSNYEHSEDFMSERNDILSKESSRSAFSSRSSEVEATFGIRGSIAI